MFRAYSDAMASHGVVRFRCSYKKATVFICSFNLLAAFYILQTLLGTPAYLSSPTVFFQRKHTVLGLQEVNRIKESHDIRKKGEPHELIERVKEIQLESDIKYSRPGAIREKVTLEIAQKLKELQASNNQTNDNRALNAWRKKKIEAAHKKRRQTKNNTESSTDIDEIIAKEEVTKLLELGWESLLQDGVTSPSPSPSPSPSSSAEIQENILPTVFGPEVEDGIIPGRIVPGHCHAEAHTDYDGVAVRWGLTHHTESAADCCQACIDQAKNAKGDEKRCNIWVFCAAENGCYSPDIYQHKHQECWLKQDEQPKLNFKGRYGTEYRQSHPNAPLIVSWVSGVL